MQMDEHASAPPDTDEAKRIAEDRARDNRKAERAAEREADRALDLQIRFQGALP